MYAKWEQDAMYYPARVTHVNGDGTYAVVFDDGVKLVLPREEIIVWFLLRS